MGYTMVSIFLGFKFLVFSLINDFKNNDRFYLNLKYYRNIKDLIFLLNFYKYFIFHSYNSI